MNGSLSALIRATADANSDAHPHKIARLVAEATPRDNVFEFYVVALERLVSDQIRSDRNKTLNDKKQSRSAKREERASWWARVLQERVFVGDLTYKVIGECTETDLTFCIEERRDQIGRLEGQIEKFEAIRAAMRVYGAVVVADLPEGAVTL